MNQWSVDPVGGMWFAGLVALLLVTAIWAVPMSKRLTTRRKRVLQALRLATALLLLFVLWRPTLVLTETRKLPGSLVLMVDGSRSMQITDSLADESRWNAAKQVLDSASGKLAELAEAWDIKLYQFADTVESVTLSDGKAELPEAPEGPQTAIGSALEDVLDREAQQRVVAVLLLSDGAQRAFAPRDAPPQTVVQRLAVDEIPLYTFTFGKPALGLQSDLRIDDLLVSDVVFAETPVTVKATLTADGFANQTHKARLLWETPEGEMQVVDTREVQLRGNQRQLPLNFQHTPMQPGEYKIAVQIESPAGELVTSNNMQSSFVTVMKGGVNVLYLVGATRIGGGPSLEPRFVFHSLASHADVNIRYELLDYRKQRIDIRPLLTEGKFDVFLLGDVDAIGLNNASWEQIALAVDQGAGFGMLGGFHSFGPGGFRGTVIEPLLPLRIGRAERQNFGEAPRQDMHLPGPMKMMPTLSGGQVHPILRLAPEGQPAFNWAELPSMDGANRLDRAAIRPSAQIIAETADANRQPLMVVSAWGNGRTLAFAGDSTWRWPMEGFREAHRRLWRQLVLWLARKDDTQGQSVWVRLDARRYQRGSPVEFEFGAYNQQREALLDAKYDVQVETPDGEKLTVRSNRRGEKSVARFENSEQPGDYRVTVAATHAGDLLGTAEARFTVPDRDMELDQPAAEPTLMGSLADITGEAGGQGLAPEQLPELLTELESRTAEFEEEIEQQESLWDSWPVLLSLVGLLSSEWYLRKRWGLV